jgi:hypothetical protein
MTYQRIVVDPARAGIDYAEPNEHASPDLITKKQPVSRTLEKRRQQRDSSEQQQPLFACSMHLLSRSFMLVWPLRAMLR